MDYKYKFFKYKYKYIQLKYQIGGKTNKFFMINVEKKLKELIFNNDQTNIYKLIKKYSPKNIVKKNTDKFMIILEKSIDKMLYFRYTFSYAVPTKKVINKITKFIGNDKVLEVGAGKGLWASLLDKEGVDIIATDDLSWNDKRFYIQVKKMDAIKAINKYDVNILMMIWPPNDPMAFNGLKKFEGNKLIYIGERDGCTGCDKFRKELIKNWKLVKTIDIPNWYGLWDKVYLYKRQ